MALNFWDRFKDMEEIWKEISTRIRYNTSQNNGVGFFLFSFFSPQNKNISAFQNSLLVIPATIFGSVTFILISILLFFFFNSELIITLVDVWIYSVTTILTTELPSSVNISAQWNLYQCDIFCLKHIKNLTKFLRDLRKAFSSWSADKVYLIVW